MAAIDIVSRYLRGETSGPLATMELLLDCADVEALRRELRALEASDARLEALSLLLERHDGGCRTIARMLQSGSEVPDAAQTLEESIAETLRLFESSVQESEEASVALYSLGDAELLAQASEEVVQVLDSWGVLGHARAALEIGCGIGRLLVPLAAHFQRLVGIDISPRMLAAARRRTQSLPNVELLLTEGRSLEPVASGSLDLVYAVDVMPYLVRSGPALVETHFAEVARVLRPCGDFLIFNYAYGRSRERDAEEVRALATRFGFDVVRSNEAPFRLWNGIGYLLRRGLTR